MVKNDVMTPDSTAASTTLSILLLFILLTQAVGARAEPNSDAVKRGAYLVRLGDCVSCHTAQGGKAFAGGAYMPTPLGEISVPNITPDKATGIGLWSDGDFYRAMHEGIGRKGEYLYPVFPFPWFTKVTRQDAIDIKAFLFSLPPVNSPRPPLKLTFPASVRESLLAWRTLFFKAAEFKPEPQRSSEVNRGAYLVQGLGHCGECHNQRNEVGSSKWAGRLEGGEIEGWYAPNLTSDSSEGIGSWSVDDLARFLKTGMAPHAAVALGPMKDVINDSTSHFEQSDLRAIAAYLKSVPPKEAFKATVASDFATPHAPGAAQYLSSCAFCHGIQGEGLPHHIPSLVKNGAIAAQGPQDVVRVVLGGVPATQGLAPMPAVGASMSDQEIADVVNYVRNAFGNAAPGTAAPGLVAQLRATTKTALAGNLEPCPAVTNTAIARALSSKQVAAKLHNVTDTNVLAVINEVLPRIRRAAPRSTTDEIVNSITNSYCAVLAADNVPAAQRGARIGNFATLVFGQLQSNGRE